MSRQATAVVRAKITGSRSALRGTDVYTYLQLQVLETWKSPLHPISEVAVPGGAANGIRQMVPGVPALKVGEDYVLFLWTSRSGLTQIMGLSQGVFRISADASGRVFARRPAATELMVDRSGHPVADHQTSFEARDLRARVLQALGAPK